MKLALVMTGNGKEGNPPLALGYLASYLRKYMDFNNRSNFFANTKFKDLFSIGLIKLALSQPKESARIIFELIRGKFK